MTTLKTDPSIIVTGEGQHWHLSEQQGALHIRSLDGKTDCRCSIRNVEGNWVAPWARIAVDFIEPGLAVYGPAFVDSPGVWTAESAESLSGRMREAGFTERAIPTEFLVRSCLMINALFARATGKSGKPLDPTNPQLRRKSKPSIRHNHG